MKPLAIGCAAIAAALRVAPAEAGEIFGGLYVHDVKSPLDKSGIEDGFDFHLAFAAVALYGTPLQPYSSARSTPPGRPSYAAVGISAKFGGRLLLPPGHRPRDPQWLGRPNTTAPKDRVRQPVLFEPEFAVGAAINGRLSVEASWVHMSHAQLVCQREPRDRQSRLPAEPGALAADIVSGFTTRSNVSSSTRPGSIPASFSVCPSCGHAWRSWQHYRSRFRRESRDEHQRAVHQFGDPLLVGLRAVEHPLREAFGPRRQQVDRADHVRADQRLEDVSSMALHAADSHGDVIAHHLRGDHRQHLGLGRVTLPGMIELPGSFSGSFSSPRPHRGPEPSKRMSLAIFVQRDRDDLEDA